MAKQFARKFYNSSQWKKCRASFISYRMLVDGGVCQHCGNEQGYIVDHIVELNPDNINNPEISLNHRNFQYLCLECHNRKTFEKEQSVEIGYRFNQEGMLVPVGGPPIKIEE